MLASSGSTVVITTHYLEEVKAADRIGFARQGRILAEDAPGNLLAKYGTDSLETVFHKLCSSGFDEVDRNPGDAIDTEPLIVEKRAELNGVEDEDWRISHETSNGPRDRNLNQKFKALIFKNLKVLQRHKVLMSFQVSRNALT